MLVIAVLAIFFAIAGPSLSPLNRDARELGAVAKIAAFFERARQTAVAEQRCVRILATPTGLSMQRRTSGDCIRLDIESEWAPVGVELRLDGGYTWSLEARSLPLGAHRPAATGAPSPSDNALVVRPSGRLWGNGNVNVRDDGARAVVQVGAERRAAIYTSTGRICSVRGTDAALAISAPAATDCP